MSHVLVVDTADQQQIHRLTLTEGQSLVVGRSWQSDIIINDEFVDAQHLQLSVDERGLITATDLDSRNGSRLSKKLLTNPLEYQLGARITLGESTITLFDAEEVVTPATKQDAVHKLSRVFSSFFWVTVATLLLGGALYVGARWGESTELTSESLVQLYLQHGIMIFGFSVVAGFVGRLFRNKTYFKLHWSFLCIVVATSVLIALIADVLRFNLDTATANSVLMDGQVLVLLAIVVYGTLSLSTRIGFAGKGFLAIVLASLPLMFSLSKSMLAEEHEMWTYSASVERINQPPSLFFRKPITIAEHISGTETLFAELDAEIELLNSEETDSQERPPAEPLLVEVDKRQLSSR